MTKDKGKKCKCGNTIDDMHYCKKCGYSNIGDRRVVVLGAKPMKDKQTWREELKVVIKNLRLEYSDDRDKLEQFIEKTLQERDREIKEMVEEILEDDKFEQSGITLEERLDTLLERLNKAK